MQNQNVEQPPSRPVPNRLTLRARLGMLGVVLALLAAIGASAVNHVLPNRKDRSQGVAARVAWYVQHQQWRADLHSLALAVEYVLSSEPEGLPGAADTNHPVAENAISTSPRS